MSDLAGVASGLDNVLRCLGVRTGLTPGVMINGTDRTLFSGVWVLGQV